MNHTVFFVFVFCKTHGLSYNLHLHYNVRNVFLTLPVPYCYYCNFRFYYITHWEQKQCH